MTTYLLDKFSYFLFQDSASEVSYSGERIIIKVMIANNVMYEYEQNGFSFG